MAATGRSRRWNEAEIAALAVLTLRELSAADLMLGEKTARYAKLLAVWDSETLSYRSDLGRKTSDAELKRIALLMLLALLDDVESMTLRLLQSKQTIGEWQLEVAMRLRELHAAMAILAAGGIERLDESDVALVSASLRYQFSRLERFARLLELRDRRLSTDAEVLARIRQYARASSETFEVIRRWAAIRAGYLLEKNVLGDAEHCPECLQITALAWQPIGSLKPPGTRLCRGNCKCRLVFSRNPPQP